MTGSGPEVGREIIGYRLTLTIAGPHHQDVVVIENKDRESLGSELVEVYGIRYERYNDGDGYIEFDRTSVVARRLEVILQEPRVELTSNYHDGPHATGLDLLELPTEQRIWKQP